MSAKKDRSQDFATTITMVESVIAELSLSPQENRLEVEGGAPAWGLLKGSAQVFIFINPGGAEDEGNHLQVVSPVVHLPEDPTMQLRLFRHVLKLNAQTLAGVAFGLKDDTIVLAIDRSTVDLDPSEVKEMVLKVGYYADLYDDTLAAEYQTTRHTD
jgi:hypothetical protein